MTKTFAVLAFSLLLLSLCATSFAAAIEHSAARLFQARSQDGAWTAGLEIRLDDGWKTYWRIPGDSGIPPQFDWSGSSNLAAVTVGWPAPRRYSDAAGETIGYRDRIVLPLRIEPRDPHRPVAVALSLFYAVCRDICIPVEEKLALDLEPNGEGAPADRALLQSFVDRIPAATGLLPRVESLRLLAGDGGNFLEVSLAGALPAASTDIFVEGYSKAYFRKPRASEAQSDTARFHLKIDGLADAADLRGRVLTLTLTAGGLSRVQSMTVE